jgi:serine/threonine-protein kinase
VLASLAEIVGLLPSVLLHDSDPTIGVTPVVRPSSEEMPPPAARTERLRLLGEIARGGMGAILKGRDEDIGRDLAVKVLLEKHRDRPELIRRFIEEAQIGGQLQHPGVVPIYELGAFTDRRPYFTMKLVKGRTLADLLAARPDPTHDQPRALGIFLQVCQTVAYAHARGVIHRDLKPSNVMVGGFGEVQVMDWGLAKVLPKGGIADDETAGGLAEHETVIATARGRSDAELSQVGSVLGTPAYMAPEQARGEIDRVDERADVFALGSMLCEVLTGRPAFLGRSAGEIHRKAARGELADAFARLDACGAHPELLALARVCLASEREDRPRDAGGVASSLSSYLAGVQERLRQAELARAQADARAEEERKRRKLALALAAAVVALMAVGGTGATIYLQQRQAQAARLAVALRDVELLRQQAQSDPEGDPTKWRAAVAATERAADLLGPLIDARSRRRVRDLQEEVRQAAEAAEADAKLLRAVVDIRSAEADDPDGSISDADYARAFRNAGLDVDTLGPDAAGAKIRTRPPGVALAVAAALDDWTNQRRRVRPKDETGWGRLSATARAVDRDETRDRLRAIWAQADRKAQRGPLLGLAKEADPQAWPPASLILLADALYAADERDAAIELLRRAQAHQPGDVWLSYRLALWLEAMHPPRTEEAIGYYRAARALRPETAHALAHLLERRGRGEEAVAVFQDLVRLRLDNGRHWGCYGRLLKDRGDPTGAGVALEKAVAALREAIRLRPDGAIAHTNLGNALRDQGKLAEAVAEFGEAIRLQPDEADAHNSLGNALRDQGKLAEAVAEFGEAIRLRPDDALADYNLGLALSSQGKVSEAIAAYREAIRLKPDYIEAHYNLGHVLQQQGHFREGLDEMRRGHELGSQRPDWRHPSPEWLRRAERLAALEARLPAVIRGEDKPEDGAEGTTLADMAYKAGRHGASARLYDGAFRSDPKLAEDMNAQHRYNAACAAALAGCGQGKDNPPPDAAARAKLRGQALGWLKDELAAWSKMLDDGNPAARAAARPALDHWKVDTGLAGLRDEAELAKFPDEERAACRALWTEVDHLRERAGHDRP